MTGRERNAVLPSDMPSRPARTARRPARPAADQGRPHELPGRWAELGDAYGGAEALALALGVDRMTLWRWSREVSPVGGPQKIAISALALAKGVKSPV